MLLGTTAVIRLKSPLAHGGYSKTIDRFAWPRVAPKVQEREGALLGI
jgi:hypothetical protein